VPFSALEAALVAALSARGVSLQRGESCERISLGVDAAAVRFTSGREVQARLLVLADGGANATKIPGIAFVEKDYRQQAIVASLRSDRPHAFRAYERFTPGGPVALLPVDDRFALVWTASPEAAARLLELDDARFLDELQAHFGDRAGRFVAVGPRTAFPLKLRAVNTPIALRTAIIGNAAQALHPIAGQGLNLGLRDAATLAALLHSTAPEALGSEAMLASYQDARRRDSSRGVMVTDLLVSAFANPRRLPTWGRGLALAALDLFPPARRLLAERMIHGAPQ
jgi:2-octaprenyl-6-methoxyphenol hydroxylase